MRNFYLLTASILMFSLLSGCETESGTPSQIPNKATQPKISFGTHFPVDNTGGTLVPNYTSVGIDSADLTITMGAKQFTFGDRDMKLSGFGSFTGSSEVHRFSVQQDSRGIKGVRQGLYHVSGNVYDEADFHYLAKDEHGNIILTETTSLAKTDANQRPFMQTFPSIVFKNNLDVGESWVSGATYIPWFYDFNRGWKVTLVDDDAIAPASGEPGCIVLFYQRTQQAYYVYLKDEIGIVDVIWEWEKEAVSGNILPLGGYSYKPASAIQTGVAFQGYGFENSTSTDSLNSDIVEMPVGRSAFVQVNGDSAYTYAGTATSVPANTTGFDSYWIGDDSSCTTSTTQQIQLCDLQFLDNLSVLQQRISFSHADFSAISGFYQPRIRVMVDDDNDGTGAIYRADNSTAGDLVIEPYYGLGEKWGLRTVMISGNVTNEANPADQRKLFMLIDLYSSRAQDIERSSYIVFEADPDNKLSPGIAGQTRRISWNNMLFSGAEPTLANTSINWGTSPASLVNSETNILCIMNAGECASSYRVAEFTLPSFAGTYYYQIQTDHNAQTVLSDIFEMEVLESSSSNLPPVPRIFTSFPSSIKGSLDNNGEFTVVVSGTQSRDPDGSIFSYAWDFSDGTLFNDSSPLVSHTYTQNGEYSITLTVTDSGGISSSISEAVLVTNIATVDITYLVLNNFSPKHEIYICDTAVKFCEIATISYFNWKETRSFEVNAGSGKQYQIIIFRTEENGSRVTVHDETIFLNAGDNHPVTLD